MTRTTDSRRSSRRGVHFPRRLHIAPMFALLALALVGAMAGDALSGAPAARAAGAPARRVEARPLHLRTAADDVCRVDMMLVLDGSLSIPAEEFNTNVREFARQVVSGLSLGPSPARIGIVQFSSQGDARLEIGLSADAAAVGGTIDGMTQIGNETDIQEGVSVGMREFRDNGRSDVPWVLVVVTDGQDTEPGDLAREADAARAAGAIIFAVGIGPEVDPAQLASIASDPELIFTVDDFLALVGLVEQLKLLFCAPPTTTPPGTGSTNSGTGPTTQELPPARCNDATNSGGAGVTTRTYDVGATSGTFRFAYNTFTIPDKIEIFYQGQVVFTTGGFVGESKEVTVAFGPGSATTVTVTVTGNTDSGTIWNYVLHCPGTGTTPMPPAPPPPPPSTGSASITTDKTDYRVGESIRICYTVPGPGPITILDRLPNGQTQVIISGMDDGRGDCLVGTVEPPTGRECFVLQFSAGGGGTRETCINVLAAPTPSAPPMQTSQQLPPARCNDATNSGGAGITTREYAMGTNGGTFSFTYDTFTVTDKIEIFYQGQLVFSTNGFVGESRTVSVSFGPGSSMTITVRVTGNPTDTSTQWNYTVRCPGQGAPGPSTAPTAPPATGQATITTNKSSYRVGESIRICYTVPGPGPVTITNILPNGQQRVLISGNDDGRGDCITGTVTPPTGRECFRLQFSGPRGSGTRETCIQVNP